jgi:predicted nucleic acid-binding protein
LATLWVVNASPVILLLRVGQLDLLRRLGPRVVIPEGIISAARPTVEELRRHGMFLSDQVMNQALSQVRE